MAVGQVVVEEFPQVESPIMGFTSGSFVFA